MDVDPIWFFIFALVGGILFAVAQFMARGRSITDWGGIAICIAGILAWWPD